MSNLENNLWKELNNSFRKSNKKIEIRQSKPVEGQTALDILKITSKSALGSILYNTSAITIDNWIRVLGSDNKENRGLISYNNIKDGIARTIDKMLIVADDIVGGIYALNSGKYPDGIGDVWYFAPDTLEWESLNLKYSEFISWLISGNTDEFYLNIRWNDWKTDAQNVAFDEAILIYPFLWSNEVVIEEADKKIVPADELLNINLEYSKKFELS